MISVVIPLYNKEKLIGNTLRSVLEQTYQDFEIVVVNDGSTDNSVAEVEKIADPRIRLIHQQNAGVSAARNKGISEAKGEFIAFLDADDEWNPDYLNVQHLLTDKYPQCDVFAVNYKFKDLGGKFSETIMRKFPFGDIDGILSNYFEVASCSHPPVWTSAVMVRKTAIQSVGGFPIGIKSGEDLLTWARLACRYKIAYNKNPLAIFNIEGYHFNEKPKRIPAEVDIVGDELVKLKQEFNPPYINYYISQWHKNRASVYMRMQMRFASIKESLIGLKFNLANYKLFAYIVINLLPNRIQPF